MESRVHLKICEGCGCLWFRAQTEGRVYCKGCTAKLREFPTPQSRRRRGRPSRKPVSLTWTAAAALGGAE
jgi:uncharacterized Zn finger protein (UPF0148 family)